MVGARDRLRPWAITALLALFMYINFADKAVIGLAAVPMMRDMALSPEQWGVVGSSFFVLFSVAAALVGIGVDRVPTKWALAAMGLVWALTQFPMLTTVSFPMLVACRVVLGAGEGPAYPVALHAAYKWFPNDRRTLPTSIIAIGAAVGVFTIAPVLVYLIERFGWHAAFGFLGVAGLVWVLAWIVYGAEGTVAVAAAAAESTDAPRIPYRSLFASRTVIGIVGLSAAVYWGLALLVVWVPALLQQGLGYGAAATTALVSLTWGAVAVCMPLIGFLSQRAMLSGRSSRAARAVPASLFAVAAGVLIVIALPIAAGALQIVLLAAGFAIGGAIYTLGPAIIGEITPEAQRGTMLGVISAVYSLAGLVAPAVTGRVIAAGPTAHDGYIHAFMLSGAIVAAGGIAGLLLIHPEADRARFRA
ncbi:MAG TPA: MFS transporter [Stellaceae bacterium]|nr:MFS transporter [Stellaceae bacterium]HXQ50438.1 MFS transporter [Stellaceae bacterium]